MNKKVKVLLFVLFGFILVLIGCVGIKVEENYGK